MKTDYFNAFTKRWKKEYTLAFLSTFIMGILVHIYKFTNYLPNHDSMYNFYSDQNVLGSGRWFLSIACGFSSYYDLPWINGLFSVAFIAATTVIITSVFEIKNPIIILLVSGFMSTFPSVTEILCFEFTADGFFFSMFLSALAVYALKTIKNKYVCILITALLICLSCGIYQAYVSFTLVLFVSWLILRILTVDDHTHFYVSTIVRLIISLALGLAAYYIVWKICLAIQGVVPTDNQGISELGALSFGTVFSSLKRTIQTLVSFVIEKNIMKHGIGLYAILNIVFLFISGLVFIIAIVKSQIYKTSKLIIVFLCVVVLPFIICMWYFTSPGVIYGIRMLHSIVVLYILSILLCEKFIKNKISLLVVALSVVITINFAVRSNIAYYYLNFEFENSYAEAIRLEAGLENAQKQYGVNHKIAIIGSRNEEVALNQKTEANGVFAFSNMIEKSLLLDDIHTENFLKNILYFDGEFVNGNEKIEISSSKQFQNMDSWFDGGSIELIDDVITVKIG